MFVQYIELESERVRITRGRREARASVRAAHGGESLRSQPHRSGGAARETERGIEHGQGRESAIAAQRELACTFDAHRASAVLHAQVYAPGRSKERERKESASIAA